MGSKERIKIKMATGFLQICTFLDEEKTILAGQLIIFCYRETSKWFHSSVGIACFHFLWQRVPHHRSCYTKELVNSWAYNSDLVFVTPYSTGAGERWRGVYTNQLIKIFNNITFKYSKTLPFTSRKWESKQTGKQTKNPHRYLFGWTISGIPGKSYAISI